VGRGSVKPWGARSLLCGGVVSATMQAWWLNVKCRFSQIVFKKSAFISVYLRTIFL